MIASFACRASVIGSAAALCLVAGDASAQSFGHPGRFLHQDGKALYEALCQACHMSEGRGAAGAGAFPALAKNDKLAASGYPVSVVVGGLKGMPGMGFMLNDDQVAAVVNYVRTHFGNDYQDAVTAADVKAARGN